jgi:archaellum component FlaC
MTKRELAQREQAEKELSTNSTLSERPEVKKNPIAHAEFIRIIALLDGIEKNDSLYEAIINRYCEIQAECYELKERRVRYESLVDKVELLLEKLEDNENIEDLADLILKTTTELDKITKSIDNIDKMIQSKRKMLFDIEKENIFTIASALRSIPKKPEKKRDLLLEALSGHSLTNEY